MQAVSEIAAQYAMVREQSTKHEEELRQLGSTLAAAEQAAALKAAGETQARVAADQVSIHNMQRCILIPDNRQVSLV